ncbi:PEP-CTERM sorting domain-containing protein [Janthinobacterium sp. Mn2066]|uniref:PEP-CTERM sorting domain-containing protein n=1 Tax=Janthinobacterium sp. Mn2066 TaxID=3395264 RepID=UPI003BC552C6
MMKKLILLTAALTLSASSNLAGADSTRHHLSQLPSPQPYEPSTPALLMIAAGLLVLRMRNQSNDSFVGK